MDTTVKIILVIVALGWAVSGVWLAVVDVKEKLLPKRIIYPALGVAVVGYVAAAIIGSDTQPLLQAFVGGIGCFAVFYALYLINSDLMGGGDVRLVGLNGFVVGWFGYAFPWFAIVAALILALPASLIVLVIKGPRSAIPFGPYLIAGTALFLGVEVVYFVMDKASPIIG